MVNFYHCPMCGSVSYNYPNFGQYPYPGYVQTSAPSHTYLVQQEQRNLVPPSELAQLAGKQIQTTVPILGTVTACVGNYDASRNRVSLSNITNVQTGVNHGAMDYLPEELVGYRVISETCTGGAGRPDQGRQPEQTGPVATTVIRKTIASAHLPRSLTRMQLYRAYIDVTVPTSFRGRAQQILDTCMENATNAAKAYMVTPVATALGTLNPGPIVAALPGAVAEAVRTFTTCVGSEPEIYPYILNNTIKITPGSGWA
ncbi:hypothetical protein D1B33_05440 [Lysinibacillus yapensis]|uniref:Uncharacterized protein n=1 Tax=Ureibacillus yapensis TaxID=2304605 RepID=A0A396SBC2_9BACL|nr:hypothetical protein [Lysinibacillus yapensis]RHW38330.1 hypothetical protein D1B33_05440 [Lysinibacillus yapensis]